MKKVFSLITLALAASFANAVTINATLSELGPYKQGKVAANGAPIDEIAGRLDFTLNEASSNSPFSAFCADIHSPISLGSTHDFVVTLTPLDNSPLAKAGHIVSTYAPLATDAAQNAGLQLAVWEAIHENGSAFTVDGTVAFPDPVWGDIATEGTALFWANQYYGATSGQAYYLDPGNGIQGQLTATPVPEPASIACLGFGLIALRRRRQIK